MEELIAQVIADTAAKERTEEIIAYILKWDSRQAQGELARAIEARFLGRCPANGCRRYRGDGGPVCGQSCFQTRQP